MQRNALAACAASIMFFGFASHADADGNIIHHQTFDLNTPAGTCRTYSAIGGAVFLEDASKKAICAITGISGHFSGGGENGSVTRNDLGNWVFQGLACQPGVSFTVTCFN